MQDGIERKERNIKPRRKVDGDIATPSRVVARLSTDRKNRQDSSPSFILSPRISLNITRRSTKDFRWRRDEANWNCLESRNQPATFVSLVCPLPPLPSEFENRRIPISWKSTKGYPSCEKFHSLCKSFNLQKFCYLSSVPKRRRTKRIDSVLLEFIHKAFVVALSTLYIVDKTSRISHS